MATALYGYSRKNISTHEWRRGREGVELHLRVGDVDLGGGRRLDAEDEVAAILSRLTVGSHGGGPPGHHIRHHLSTIERGLLLVALIADHLSDQLIQVEVAVEL